MDALNLALFQWMAAGDHPGRWLLPLARAIAQDGAWAGAALTAWAAWHQPRERGYVFAALIAAGVTALVAHKLAAAFNLPRPFMLGLSPDYIDHGNRGSLPSAHASVMFAIALIFALRQRLRVFGVAMAALALATGWARIYVGVHFPLDIAAGLLLAVGVAAIFQLLNHLSRRYLAPAIAKARS